MMVNSTRRQLVVSGSLLAALPFNGVGRARAGEPQSGRENQPTAGVDALELVPPELRAPLQKMLSVSKPEDIGTRNLAAERAFDWPGLPAPAASPRYEKRVLPGRKGAPDVAVYLINPQPAGSTKAALLHIHGGGFILGRVEESIPLLQSTARELDCVVVTVDYRLAPETPFPGSLEDNYTALLWLHKSAKELGVDPARIAVMGESAGGGHAAMLAIASRDRAEVSIAAQILIYPMLDDRTGSTRAVPEHIGTYVWTRGSNRFGWSSLLGKPAGSEKVPYGAVPARVTDLSRLPPTFIGVGSIDLFAEEDIGYAQRLLLSGVPVELDVVPGGYHAFDLIAADAPLARRFRDSWIAALRRAWLTPCLMLLLADCCAALSQAASPIDLTQAKAAFTEAETLSNEEGGKLWGRKIYGSLFFVDPETRFVVANESDPGGVLHPMDGVYVGTLPKKVIISNAPIEWDGKRWTMLIWQSVPADVTSRRIVFAHEMFHRMQPGLGLAAEDSSNLQLDTPAGRLWLQLEWRALAVALVEQGFSQMQAIRDALLFRSHRHTLFPNSAKTEASLEIAEGIPEYTGVIAGEPDRGSARWRTVAKLSDPDLTISFVRSFAYTSGPPYGLLLDERLPGWRTKLAIHSDLGALLASTLQSDANEDAETRAAGYGAPSIRIAEAERAQKIEATRARYQALLVNGSTLVLPGGHHFAFSFNPSALIAMGDSDTVYPTFHATAEWGVLDVTDGVLLPTDFSRATVAAPEQIKGAHLKGPGWTLDLAPGWIVVPAAKGGNFAVVSRGAGAER